MALRLRGKVEAPTTAVGVGVVRFRIYVAGEAPNSVLAVRNLRALCTAHFDGNFIIDVVDVLLSPERAWGDGVIVTPTTQRVAPSPSAQIVGNLSDLKAVMCVFGLAHG
jgi:circadian clock protein KaiB